MRDRRIHVVDVQGDMVAADVAVAGHVSLAVSSAIGEDLEVRAVAESVEPDLGDLRPRVHIKLPLHPVVVAVLAGQRVDVVCAEHPDEEVMCGIHVGNSDADVV